MAAIMLETIPSFYAKISGKKISLFLQKHMKITLFVKTTASPITTIRRVLYPLVNITLYYLKKLRNCLINWIHFVSPINKWTVFIPCSSTASLEKLLQRVEMCLTICRKQSPLTKETEELTKCRVLQKRGTFLHKTMFQYSLRCVRHLDNSIRHRSNNTSCTHFRKDFQFWFRCFVPHFSLNKPNTCRN